MWKKDDMNHAREFRNQSERQYCNAFNWESTFVPEIQPTPEQQAQHTAMIEDEYLQHQIQNAQGESKQHHRNLKIGSPKKSKHTYGSNNNINIKSIMSNLISILRRITKPQFYNFRKITLHYRTWR